LATAAIGVIFVGLSGWAMWHVWGGETIQVAPFELFTGDSKIDEQKGKALADLLVDDLHQILEEANQFSGNSYSSKKANRPRLDLPKIPVDTTYGIELKGISLDQLFATWKHLRYQEFRVSGDMIKVADGQFDLKVRYETEGRANSFEVRSSPANLQKDLRMLALKLMGEISPLAAERYLWQESLNCPQCKEVAGTKPKDFCWDWLTRAPQDPEAVYCLGYLLAVGNSPHDALPFLEESTALFKKKRHFFWQTDNSYGPLNTKGHVLIHEKKFDEAAKALKASLKARKMPGAMMNLGVVAESEGKYADAQKWYLKALKMDRDYVGALMNLGHSYLMENSYQQAADNFRKALELEPGKEKALIELSFALAREGRSPEAHQTCEEALRLGMEQQNRLYAAEAMIDVLTREPSKAVGVIQSRNNRPEKDLLYQLMLAYLEERDLPAADRVASDLRDRWSRNGEDSEIEYALGRILEAEGDRIGADKHLKNIPSSTVFDSYLVKEVEFALGRER
jgi:tetratricopeptide (TPR) repeat protein